MQALIIIIFAFIIFVFTYFASNGNNLKKAAISLAIAAVIGFVAPYIVEFVGKIDKKADVGNVDDISAESPLGHEHKSAVEEKKNITDATCLDAGSYVLVTSCKCGEELSRETFTIEPLGHDYIDVVTEPSCEKTGFTTHTCNRCGDSYVDDYIDAPGHDFVGEICTGCGAVSSEYEPLIVSQANELINSGDYDGALNIVIKALDIIDSDSLRQLLSHIQAMQENDLKYTAKNVDFITYSGAINSSDQTDTYSLEAPVTGYYRFDVSDMVSGFNVKIYIYNSMGAKVGGGSGIGNDGGVTCELIQGESYTVNVISYLKTGSYTLTIGQQKENIDISAKEIICDSIEYIGQQNEYVFIPSIDGTYRFDFSDVVSGFSVKCYVYDSLGYKVGGSSGLGNGDGVTIGLTSNEIYTIKVIQYSNKGSYTLTIGKQQATQDLTEKNAVSGKITYRDQKNNYIYTPSSTEEYILSLYNMINGFSVKLYVYDSLGYKVGGCSGAGNGYKLTVKLTEGETYTIQLIQYSNMGSYDMDILHIENAVMGNI